MFAFVLLIYKTLESSSHTISEALLSSVSRVISPVLRWIRLHQAEDWWASKEYCDVEKNAAS